MISGDQFVLFSEVRRHNDEWIILYAEKLTLICRAEKQAHSCAAVAETSYSPFKLSHRAAHGLHLGWML